MKTSSLTFVFLACAALSGCATVSFKRGASSDAAAADERACREANADEAGFTECMRKRGYYVSGAKTSSPKPKPEKTEPEPAAAAEPAAVAPVPPVTSEPSKRSLPPASAAAATSEPPAQAVAPAPVVPAPEPPAHAGASALASAPLERFDVTSWWKLGGTPADLDRAIDQCVATLGPVHRPDPNARVVTNGLYACLRSDGWYAR